MYILWYSPEIKSYTLDFVNTEDSFEKGNELDVLYKFKKDELNIARSLLRNLNIAGKQAA